MGALEGEEEGEGEEHLQLVGTKEVVALGSQLLVGEEEGEGQRNQGEVEKMEVMVAEGSQETQIL